MPKYAKGSLTKKVLPIHFRNLICVYSKKHMYDVPELAEMKRKANMRSLKEMALLLRYLNAIVILLEC